jgi:thiol-disulfide isomerase/thioredoxin
VRKRDPTLFWILGLGALVVGLAVAQGHLERTGQPRLGEPAPEIVVPGLAGGEWRLSSLRGKVVLVDFWARWCDPCVEQMPALQRLFERMRDRPFVLFSVNIEGAPAREVRRWLDERGFTFPAAQDRTGLAREAFRASRIPLLVLIGSDGIVRKVYGASASEGSLAEDVESLLRGPAA